MYPSLFYQSAPAILGETYQTAVLSIRDAVLSMTNGISSEIYSTWYTAAARGRNQI